MAQHQPVLCAQIVEWLVQQSGGRFLDLTLGDGGHASALLAAAGTAAQLVGVDQDGDALARARGGLAPAHSQITYRHENFADAVKSLQDEGERFSGIVADLGFSSPQIDEPARGLSFRMEGPLDMRMDQRRTITAETLVNTASETELADWFFYYGEERASRRVAKAIVNARVQQPITTTTQLANIVRRVLPGSPRIDPATKIFQALRIAVNGELEVLEQMLAVAPHLLAVGGRMAVLSYHSLEDRLVKQSWRALAADGNYRLLVKRPLIPADEEIAGNPRARSAKLRGIERAH